MTRHNPALSQYYGNIQNGANRRSMHIAVPLLSVLASEFASGSIASGVAVIQSVPEPTHSNTLSGIATLPAIAAKLSVSNLISMWRGMYHGVYGQGRRRGGADIYTLMLLAQLFQRIGALERKPPVTLAVMAGCFLTFFQEVLPRQLQALIPSVGKACIQPYMILQNRQWSRLIWAAFLHADEMHLYYNMSSLLWKGVQLEQQYGSLRFAGLLVELLLMSHGLFVGAAALAAAYVPEYGYLYHSNCAIGISAVLFALKVVLQHSSPGYSSVLGITLPTKYMAWAELVLASLFNPQASFLGHLAGILAGLLHVRLIAPALAAIGRWWRGMILRTRIRLQPGTARFAAADSRPGRQQTAARSPAAATATAPEGLLYGVGGSNRGGRTVGVARTAARDQQQGSVLAGDVTEAVRAAPLSAEELRLRRLQRFG